jgi:hypothetical protein
MKMVMFFTRKPGLTDEQFREHYETRHAPLAMRLFPFFKDYRRNYVRHDLAHARADGGFNPPVGFDCLTELTFRSRADYERMVELMADPAVRSQVIEDEERVFDRGKTVVFMVDELASAIPAGAAA